MSDNPLLPKPRETVVELFSGDFEPRMQELQRKMAEAAERESATKRFGAPKSEAMQLAQEYDALLEQARAEGVVRLLLRAAGRRWRQLKDEHPPRKDNDEDEVAGINRASFFEPAVKLCIVNPEFTDEQYDEFVENLSSASWHRVSMAAWTVNEGEVTIPKSSAVSLLRQMRDDALKSAESTASTPEPSTASPSPSDTTTQPAA